MTIAHVACIIQTAIAGMQLPGATYSPWSALSDEDIKLHIGAVEHFIDAIRDGQTINGEDAHLYWLRNRESCGWTYGPVRDYANKTHPSMIPFKQLSTLERAKDVLYVEMVRALEPVVVR